jgi:hypothetical protein
MIQAVSPAASQPVAPERGPLNAFCVDLEEWFHSFGIRSRYNDPRTWDDAPSCVVADTEVLMRLLDDAGARGTFLTVGWVAKKHPDLIRRLAREGHEVGCHSYWHRLVFEMTPEEFERDLADCLAVLRDLTGQPVDTYRAPGFSVKTEAFWCYPIMRRHGITTDISVVPAQRDHRRRHPLLPGFRDDDPRPPHPVFRRRLHAAVSAVAHPPGLSGKPRPG